MFFFYKWDFLLSTLLHEPGCGDVYPDIKPSRYRNLRWQGWLGRHVITKVDLPDFIHVLFIHVLYSRACWIGWALFTCSDFGEREREPNPLTKSGSSWKGTPGIRNLTKIQCGIRETFMGYGIWLLPEKRDSPKFGHGMPDWERQRYWGWWWEKVGMRDSCGKGVGMRDQGTLSRP